MKINSHRGPLAVLLRNAAKEVRRGQQRGSWHWQGRRVETSIQQRLENDEPGTRDEILRLIHDPATVQDAVTVAVALSKKRGLAPNETIQMLASLAKLDGVVKEYLGCLLKEATAVLLYPKRRGEALKVATAGISDPAARGFALGALRDEYEFGEVLKYALSDITDPALLGKALGAATADISGPDLRGSALRSATENVRSPETLGIILREATANISDPVIRGKVIKETLYSMSGGYVLGLATADITDPVLRGKILWAATDQPGSNIERGAKLGQAARDIEDPWVRGRVLGAATSEMSDLFDRGRILDSAIAGSFDPAFKGPAFRGSFLRGATQEIADPADRGKVLGEATSIMQSPGARMRVLRLATEDVVGGVRKIIFSAVMGSDANFVAMNAILRDLSSPPGSNAELRFAAGLVCLDTPLLLPEAGHTYAPLIRVADHHGPLAHRKENTVGQLAAMFKKARAAAGFSPEEKAVKNDPRLRSALRRLNLRHCTTDNLADGVDAVLMAQNQKLFLSDPALLDLYEKALHFVDFEAFTPAFTDQSFESLPPHVILALAIFAVHDSAIANKSLKFAGADRFTSENARAIIEWVIPRLKENLTNASKRNELARQKWEEVTSGAKLAKEQAVVETLQIDGQTVGYFYDNSKMTGKGYFAAQLAFARAHPKAPFYIKTINLPDEIKDNKGQILARKRIFIICIPYGQPFPNGQYVPGSGLEAALKNADNEKVAALKSAASADTLSAVKPVAAWIARDDVLLTLGGTFLSPANVKALIETKLASLFRPSN